MATPKNPKTTKKAPVKKTAKSPSKTKIYSKTPSKSLFSSKKVILVFIIAFAIIGAVYLRFSHAATDPVVDAKASNANAFQEIKADAAKQGVKIETINVGPKPANWGTPPPDTKPAKPANYKTLNPPLPEVPSLEAATKSSFIERLVPKAEALPRANRMQYTASYIGWHGRDFYNYGIFPSSEEWCGDFVSYIMAKTGQPFWWGKPGSDIPGNWRITHSDTIAGGLNFLGALRDRSYTPQPGDIVFFEWGPNSPVGRDHVGFVESVDSKGYLHTIEGNINDGYRFNSVVERRTWALNDGVINGYGVLN